MPKREWIWIGVVCLASVVCWQVAQSAPKKDEDAELYRLFVDALEHVDRSYVKPVERRQLVESAINGMLDGLDPYSNFIGVDEWKQFNRQTVGKFGGIGIQISLKDKDLTVISPLVGTPAYEAGILAGDRILKVNDEKVEDLSLNQVVDKLTGPPGSDVKLTIQHKPYTSEPIDVTLTRAIINIESVLADKHRTDDTWDFMIDPKSKIGYIRINSFIQNTKEDLEKAITQLQKEGMRGLVLDLRYNPGGLLSAAIEVSDLFVSDGKIVSTKGRNTVDKVYSAEKAGTLPDFPMVVLVNQYSASASEIVSACLQDHKRAVVIGERTWGKGSVQNVIELEGGKSALKLTTAGYRRPNGHNIHRFKDSKEEDEWGVKPDDGYEVKFSPEEHVRYSRWRQERDRVEGKAAARKKAQEAAAKNPAKTDEQAKADESAKKADAKPEDSAKKPDAKPVETAKAEKKADGKTEEKKANAKKDAAKEAEENKPFEDRQLAKAMDYLRGELTKQEKVAEAPKADAPKP